MLDELRAARRPAATPTRFRRTAHSLKSNSNTFGAIALGAIARELELTGSPPVSAAEARRSTRWPPNTRASPRP